MRSRFAEYGYRYSIRFSDLSEEQMDEAYKFYANLFAKDSVIWWTSPGGRCGGGSLDDFFSILHMDGDYAFGPTKKQSGWPMEKLDEIGAIGVYKKVAAKPKSPAKRTSRKS